MTPQDLDRLDELASKATPGPWGVYRITYEHQPGHLVIGSPDPRDLKHDIYPTGHDAAFIAAADPSTVRALIAEVRRLRRGVEKIQDYANKAECASALLHIGVLASNLLVSREWSDNGEVDRG